MKWQNGADPRCEDDEPAAGDLPFRENEKHNYFCTAKKDMPFDVIMVDV